MADSTRAKVTAAKVAVVHKAIRAAKNVIRLTRQQRSNWMDVETVANEAALAAVRSPRAPTLFQCNGPPAIPDEQVSYQLGSQPSFPVDGTNIPVPIMRTRELDSPLENAILAVPKLHGALRDHSVTTRAFLGIQGGPVHEHYWQLASGFVNDVEVNMRRYGGRSYITRTQLESYMNSKDHVAYTAQAKQRIYATLFYPYVDFEIPASSGASDNVTRVCCNAKTEDYCAQGLKQFVAGHSGNSRLPFEDGFGCMERPHWSPTPLENMTGGVVYKYLQYIGFSFWMQEQNYKLFTEELADLISRFAKRRIPAKVVLVIAARYRQRCWKVKDYYIKLCTSHLFHDRFFQLLVADGWMQEETLNTDAVE